MCGTALVVLVCWPCLININAKLIFVFGSVRMMGREWFGSRAFRSGQITCSSVWKAGLGHAAVVGSFSPLSISPSATVVTVHFGLDAIIRQHECTQAFAHTLANIFNLYNMMMMMMMYTKYAHKCRCRCRAAAARRSESCPRWPKHTQSLHTIITYTYSAHTARFDTHRVFVAPISYAIMSEWEFARTQATAIPTQICTRTYAHSRTHSSWARTANTYTH